jgi:major membrane immunogen (membrane-anchored lipoprotein)
MTDTADHESDKDYVEIKMNAGWFMTITLASSEKYDNEYIEIAKERGGQKRSRFNLNPKYTRQLGEALIKFADANNL